MKTKITKVQASIGCYKQLNRNPRHSQIAQITIISNTRKLIIEVTIFHSFLYQFIEILELCKILSNEKS